jgi:hypothetical protein
VQTLVLVDSSPVSCAVRIALIPFCLLDVVMFEWPCPAYFYGGRGMTVGTLHRNAPTFLAGAGVSFLFQHPDVDCSNRYHLIGTLQSAL